MVQKVKCDCGSDAVYFKDLIGYCNCCVPRGTCECTLFNNEQLTDNEGNMFPCTDFLYYTNGIDKEEV